MGPTEKLARFVVETSFEHIPAESVDLAKKLALKCLGAMLIGSTDPLGKKITRYVRQGGGTPEAGVIAGGFRTVVEYAALALGTLAHAAELEDDAYPGAASPVTVIPVVFSLGEKCKASGKDVIEAFVLGFEVQGRLAMACDLAARERGILPINYYGVVGAAAAAAKMLELNVEQTRMALSIAASQAASLIGQAGWMAHMLESGFASRSGVVAAMLAKEGVTANPDIIETKGGLAGVLGEGCDLGRVTKDLGKPFFIHNVWVKKYPCCFVLHRHIDALSMLVKEHSISYEQVEGIEIEISPQEARSCKYDDPSNGLEAKFSYPHTLAAVLLDGKVDMGTFTDETAVDPRLKEARSKVKVIVHQEWSKTPQAGIATVTVIVKGGGKLTKVLSRPVGSSETPLTEADMVALYQRHAQSVLSEAQIQKTVELVLDLDQGSDILELMNIVTFETRRSS